jgi:hypothetical protein
MPYITFSKKFKDQRAAKRVLEGSKTIKQSIVILRGNKTIKRIVTLASATGFKAALIINSSKDNKEFQALEIKITPTNWKYAKTKKIVIK